MTVLRYHTVLTHTHFIVTASRMIITPTRNIAMSTPPIMYRLSFGASGNKEKKDKENVNKLIVCPKYLNCDLQHCCYFRKKSVILGHAI